MRGEALVQRWGLWAGAGQWRPLSGGFMLPELLAFPPCLSGQVLKASLCKSDTIFFRRVTEWNPDASCEAGFSPRLERADITESSRFVSLFQKLDRPLSGEAVDSGFAMNTVGVPGNTGLAAWVKEGAHGRARWTSASTLAPKAGRSSRDNSCLVSQSHTLSLESPP